jgi:hypothetical protein
MYGRATLDSTMNPSIRETRRRKTVGAGSDGHKFLPIGTRQRGANAGPRGRLGRARAAHTQISSRMKLSREFDHAVQILGPGSRLLLST